VGLKAHPTSVKISDFSYIKKLTLKSIHMIRFPTNAGNDEKVD
jgi:hypothetical protein